MKLVPDGLPQSHFRLELLDSYQSELATVLHFKKQGVEQLLAYIWDFTGESGAKWESDITIPIDTVISEIERRMDILSNPDCSAEACANLNRRLEIGA